MNQFFTDKIELVKASFPSVYTKDDVVKVIEDLYFTVRNEIDDKEKKATAPIISITDRDMRDFADAVSDCMSDYGLDIIRECSMSMSYGNTVEIDGVSYDQTRMSDIAYEHIKDFVKQFVNKNTNNETTN